MKNRTVYARELRRFLNRLKRTGPKPALHVVSDPLKDLILAVLSEDNSPSRARAALSRLMTHMVDYNDLRVSRPEELAAVVQQDLPNALERTTVLVRILNAIYDKENEVSLQTAKAGGRREFRQYLERLDGMTPYVLASIMLWVFGEHNVPVDDAILSVLKQEQVVDPQADIPAVQAFLKKEVGAKDAKAVALLLKRHAAQRGARVTTTQADRRRRRARKR